MCVEKKGQRDYRLTKKKGFRITELYLSIWYSLNILNIVDDRI